MDKEVIDDVICNILQIDGPDGHVDGHEVITDFIIALLENKGKEWMQNYYQQHNIEE